MAKAKKETAITATEAKKIIASLDRARAKERDRHIKEQNRKWSLVKERMGEDLFDWLKNYLLQNPGAAWKDEKIRY